MSIKEKRKKFLEAKDKEISKVKDAHESVENILFCLNDEEYVKLFNKRFEEVLIQKGGTYVLRPMSKPVFDLEGSEILLDKEFLQASPEGKSIAGWIPEECVYHYNDDNNRVVKNFKGYTVSTAVWERMKDAVRRIEGLRFTKQITKTNGITEFCYVD